MVGKVPSFILIISECISRYFNMESRKCHNNMHESVTCNSLKPNVFVGTQRKSEPSKAIAVGVVNDCSWVQLWASQVGAPGAPRRIPQLQCAPVVQVGRMVEKGQLLHVVRRLEAKGPLTHGARGFHGDFMGISWGFSRPNGESSPK